MSYLDDLKKTSTFEFTSETTGIRFRGRYTDMEQMLVSGRFDHGVLEELAKIQRENVGRNGDGTEPSREQVTEGVRYKHEVCVACLLEINGEPVTDAEEAYRWMSQPDRNRFFELADRVEADPKDPA